MFKLLKMQLGTYYTGEKYSSNFGHNTENSFPLKLRTVSLQGI
jgi:hypothetical protein